MYIYKFILSLMMVHIFIISGFCQTDDLGVKKEIKSNDAIDYHLNFKRIFDTSKILCAPINEIKKLLGKPIKVNQEKGNQNGFDFTHFWINYDGLKLFYVETPSGSAPYQLVTLEITKQQPKLKLPIEIGSTSREVYTFLGKPHYIQYTKKGEEEWFYYKILFNISDKVELDRIRIGSKPEYIESDSLAFTFKNDKLKKIFWDTYWD